MTEKRQIIGLMLVRNEDRFIGQALANILDFCDRVIVLDNASTDRTPEILEKFRIVSKGKVEVSQIRDVGESHSFVVPFVGKPVWLLAVDGDEIYDPAGLMRLRSRLIEGEGEFDSYWRLYGPVLNVARLDRKGMAHGYTSPPGHPMTKLYNMQAIERWDSGSERLHGGEMILKPGWDHREGIYAFWEHVDWEESPFRCLHVVFMRRTSRSLLSRLRLSATDVVRLSLAKGNVWTYTLTWIRYIKEALCCDEGKDKAYRRGPLVTRDASPFFAKVVP